MKLKCPSCSRTFTRAASFQLHIQYSHTEHVEHGVNAGLDVDIHNRLFSRYSTGGVVDFQDVIRTESKTTSELIEKDTNIDDDNNSFYSDTGCSTHDYVHDHDDVDFDSSAAGGDISTDLCNSNDSDDDNSDSIDDNRIQYFTPPTIPDADVPFSDNLYANNKSFSPPANFTAQLQLSDLFNRNKGSLKMYNDVIEIMNTYMNSPNFDKTSPLLKRKPFLKLVDDVFNTSTLRPTYGTITLHNGSLATVPVFDMKTMILSILHDDTLMRNENFANGLNIFTGDVDDGCVENNLFGEVHTGDAWLPAKNRICGSVGKYMPFGIIIFGDKSNTDQHGSLAVTPVTFTATFFNRRVRNNPDCWRPMAYLPNLAHGKGSGGKPTDKVQDEHICLAYALRPLIDLSEAGGFRTLVMGKEVHVKPFIHFFIGDIEGHNKWLGHYQGSKPGVSRPYRDCHCNFNELKASNPTCVYTKASEFRRAMRLLAYDKKEGTKLLKSMSRHGVNNALYQSRLPLSDVIHGANKMCPPEVLHTMDAGLTIYVFETLQ